MNLKKGKFKIVEGTRVRMVSSKDTHIVEGAYGTVVNPGIRESEVRWDSMLAIRADYRYRNELEDALIIPVYNDLLDPSGNFQIWTPEPIARIYLDDCIKYVGEDTKDLKYGDLLCVYSMTLSEYSLYAIQLSNYKLHKLDTSVCVLEGKGYALAKGTKVKVVLDSAYTEVGQTGKIYHTDYRSALPYEVIMDKGDCVWVAGCTIQNVDTEVYREEWNKDHVYPQGDFDPKCVEIVNGIVKETGCKVVVSSSWRAEANLQSIFDKVGLKFKIHSITPFGDHRGCEIRDWLASETEPYVYAILDDDRSMLAEQRKYFIKTNTVTGITDEDARHVINILNRNDMWNDKLNSLIMESMKSHDAVRTTVLRAIKTEFSNYATAKNAKPLDNAAEVAIIKKLRDQRIDNAEQYRMVGRQDLYDNEMAESLILNEFLPEVPDDKVLALGLVEVCALQGCEDGPKIPKSKMGIIIKELKAMFPAADGKQIADLVKSCVV